MESNFDFSSKKILIVDDEEINWLLIKDMFYETGALLKWARVGQEAIDLVTSGEKFDLIFMDMRMPVIDGYEATRQIKKINSLVPVVAFTAYASSEEQKMCMDAGCDDYISKPVEMQRIFFLAAKYLQRKE